MNIPELIKRRLEELGHEQRELAACAKYKEAILVARGIKGQIISAREQLAGLEAKLAEAERLVRGAEIDLINVVTSEV